MSENGGKPCTEDLSEVGARLFRQSLESATSGKGENTYESLDELNPNGFSRHNSLGEVWTLTQDKELIGAVLELGVNWEAVSQKVAGHTKEECEDRWNTKLNETSFQVRSSDESSFNSFSKFRANGYRNLIGTSSNLLDRKDFAGGIILVVDKILNAYSSKFGIMNTRYYVRIKIANKVLYTKPTKKRSGISGTAFLQEVEFKQPIQLPKNLKNNSEIEFKVFIKHRLVQDEYVGEATINAQDLFKRPSRCLVLNESDYIVMHKDAPVYLKIDVVKFSLPSDWEKPECSIETKLERKEISFPKHIMMLTRGTRGDVQPFVALARGLAEQLGWMITICTELPYKGYIHRHSKVERGCIRFRPSGGDTMKRMDSSIVRWATSLESNNMQKVVLAYSEREFFESEPALYYWAKTMKPDLLVFGFTLTSIAMILSESLNIPLIGFILQPTTMPSKQYPPVIPLSHKKFEKWVNLDKSDSGYKQLAMVKVMFENNPLSGRLNHMRTRHGLTAYQRWDSSTFSYLSETWREIIKRNVPIIVPINPITFGGKPNDWHKNAVLTNYIFLKGKSVPELSEAHAKFIEANRQLGHKIIVLAFSSMPILKADILEIAMKIIVECELQVSVMALIGDHSNDNSVTKELERQAEMWLKKGRLLVDKGSPFNRLFPLIDAVVAHGGLGTTAEAIMAEIPVIITGVQLMDQRFWGSRCYSLGIGPYPVHINRFPKKCVELIDKALHPESEWAKNAKIIGTKVAASLEDDPSGVLINVAAVKELANIAVPYVYYQE